MSILKPLTNTLGPTMSGKLARVYMVPYKNNGIGFDDENERAFQYWPESLSDSRGDIGWQEKEIPGGSHSLVQWTRCGSRRLSFTVMFSRDINKESISDEEITSGSVENVDISAAIAWLRWYTYPEYEEGSPRVIAPPMILLVFPNSGLGGARASYKSEKIGKSEEGMYAKGINEINCVMTGCDVTYNAWFEDGTPRIAEAGLEFLEVVQGGGRVKFHDRRSLHKLFSDGYKIKQQVI
jgi:hypothetical protein